jgi:hypothetical protein
MSLSIERIIALTSFDNKKHKHHHHRRHEDDDRSWVTMENEGGTRESAEGYPSPQASWRNRPF